MTHAGGRGWRHTGGAPDQTPVWSAALDDRRAHERRQRWRAGWSNRIPVPGRRSGYASASRGSTRSGQSSRNGSPRLRALDCRCRRSCVAAGRSRTGHRRATRSRSSVPSSPAGRTCIPGAGRMPGRGRSATRRSAPTSGSAACATSPGCGAGPVPTRLSCRPPMKPWRDIFAGTTPWASIRCWPTTPAGSSRPTSTRRRGGATRAPISPPAARRGFPRRSSVRARAMAPMCGSSSRSPWLRRSRAASAPIF